MYSDEQMMNVHRTENIFSTIFFYKISLETGVGNMLSVSHSQ